MRAIMGFTIEIEVELPDDWCDRCRKMQEEFGENYIGKNWTDKQIFEYIAVIRGINGVQWLEAVGEDMSKEIYCSEPEVIDEMDYITWIKE